MKNKLVFWVLTVILSALVLYSLVCIVVLPVMTNNRNSKLALIVPGNSEKPVNKANKKNKVADKDIKVEAIPESLAVSTS
jgi:hypothetical protein